MSIRCETYVIRGIFLNWDKAIEIVRDLEFPWCGKNASNTYGVLIDGMNGSYILAGHCLMCGDSSEGGGGNLDLVEISKLKYNDDEISSWLYENFSKDLFETSLDTIFITHYH